MRQRCKQMVVREHSSTTGKFTYLTKPQQLPSSTLLHSFYQSIIKTINRKDCRATLAQIFLLDLTAQPSPAQPTDLTLIPHSLIRHRLPYHTYHIDREHTTTPPPKQPTTNHLPTPKPRKNGPRHPSPHHAHAHALPLLTRTSQRHQ